MVIDFVLTSFFLPIVEKCSKTKFWSIYKEMLNDIDSTAGQQTNNQDKLQSIIENAANNTNYWQNILTIDNSIHPYQLLKSIPVSHKKNYISGFPDQVTSDKTNGSDWQYLSSAGTTGRMTVVVDFNKRDHLRAAEHLNLKLATGSPLGKRSVDIPPSACNVVCGFADQGPESLFSFIFWAAKHGKLFDSETISDMRGRFERQVMLKREVLLPLDSQPWPKMTEQLDRYLDMIVARKVKIIRALPHFLRWLAARAEQRNMSFPHVTTLLPYGGLAGESLVEKITDVFEAKYINVYGTGEVGSIGSGNQDSQVVDIYNAMVCLEVLDDQDQPVALNKLGRVVVTDLNNFAMPIIRYDIGDIAQVIEYCPQKNMPTKIKLLGRKQECLELPSGSCITPVEIQNLFFKHDGIINYQIEQITASMYKVSIVTIADIEIDCLAGQLQKELELNSPPKIKVREFILPEQSGKFLSCKPRKRNF